MNPLKLLALTAVVTGLTGVSAAAQTLPDETVNDLRTVNASFSHVSAAVERIDDLDAPLTVFGRQTNVRGFLVVMTSHLHEHLGQSVAYARANGVVPPWSGM